MPLFTDTITRLESPIDVMYLMHKVYMGVSDRTEELARRAQDGGDLDEFKLNLDAWLKHLLYHAETEDTFMTGPLREKQLQDGRMPLKDNEREHNDLREKGGHVLSMVDASETNLSAEEILSMEDEEHAKLQERVDEVTSIVDEVIEEKIATARTRRHLYQSVMALRIAEFDHFENEEAFVHPLVKDQMTSTQELECARRLLIEDDADNPRWIIELIYGEISDDEKLLLERLEEKFSETERQDEFVTIVV